MNLYLMCGLPGSGKSTLIKNYFTNYKVVSQDDFKGNKEKTVNYFKECLSNKENIVIDRCNQDKYQRKLWIKLAKEYGYNNICCIYMKSDKEKCLKRIKQRTDHPTISNQTSESKIKSILSKFEKEFELPTLEEGFNIVLYIKNDL